MMIFQQTRGILSSNDQITLDLPFAEMKSIAARVGPTPTFTRASNTTYFGPLIDIAGVPSAIPTIGIMYGRAFWYFFDSFSSILYKVYYAGDRWRLEMVFYEEGISVDSAVTNSWRPDQADWSGTGYNIVTSSTFGIIGAANNEPRFDHDPLTGVCRGLLIEEGRTNTMLKSQDFSNVAWAKTNLTVSGTLYTDPSGTSTANELVEDTLSASHTCAQLSRTATIGTTYTFSVFVKRKGTSNRFLLIGATNSVNASFISVNLTNGVTSTGIGSPGVPINVSSTAYPNGWYRVQFSVVATSAAATTLDIRLSRDGTWANRSYLGDGVQSSLIWGAQNEAGSFATSYIPTTTSALTRSADVCSITGADFTSFYNQSEGTMYIEADPSRMPASLNGNRVIVGFSSGTYTSQVMLIAKASSLARIQTCINNAVATAANNLNPFRAAIAVRTGGSYSVLGGIINANTTSSILAADRLQFRDSTGAPGGHPTCTIATLRYYKKRLPNAKLQALTA